jgi:hypothetical protein
MIDTLVTISIAVAMFYSTNWIGKHSYQSGYFEIGKLSLTSGSTAFNFVFRIFAPIAFLTLTAAVLYWVHADSIVKLLPHALIGYFIFRFAYYFVCDRYLLVNFFEFFALGLATIALYFWVHANVIEHREFLFPSKQEIGSALWLGMIAFLYTTINSIQLSETKARRRRIAYVSYQRDKYLSLYGTIINEEAQNEREKDIVLAVMIYEGLNRPRILQFIERLVLPIKGKASIGPMQVTVSSNISDETSVRLGAERLLSAYRSNLQNEDLQYEGSALIDALSAYNGSDKYAIEILEVLSAMKDGP